MDLALRRTSYAADGILSEVSRTDTSERLFRALEHAYQNDEAWEPKLPAGTYTCVCGTHALKNGVPFETFEVIGVPGHSGILFHKGNWNRDSEGCILLGLEFAESTIGEMVTGSGVAFERFMALQTGVDQFQLKVIA